MQAFQQQIFRGEYEEWRVEHEIDNTFPVLLGMTGMSSSNQQQQQQQQVNLAAQMQFGPLLYSYQLAMAQAAQQQQAQQASKGKGKGEEIERTSWNSKLNWSKIHRQQKLVEQ